MPKHKLAYVELPAKTTATMKAFFGDLFGWNFQDWGTEYAAFIGAGMDGGFNAAEGHRTTAPLAMIETDDIVSMESRVQQAGGVITLPTFEFPGGRRFHFKDPSGNELGVMQLDSENTH